MACDVVWAEVAAAFTDGAEASHWLGRLGVTFAEIDSGAALAAGDAWREYRRGGGRRDRVIPDFLIGSHALIAGDRLLTRDRGFYRSYFTSLEIFDPSA